MITELTRTTGGAVIFARQGRFDQRPVCGPAVQTPGATRTTEPHVVVPFRL